jgi:hypothetical protein
MSLNNIPDRRRQEEERDGKLRNTRPMERDTDKFYIVSSYTDY